MNIKAIIEIGKIAVDREKRNQLFMIITFPIIFIIVMLFIFFGGENKDDIFYKAVKEVKVEHKIDNNLNSNLVRQVFILSGNDFTIADITMITNFISTYFIKTVDVYYLPDDTLEISKENTEVTEETRFLTITEVSDILKKPPFSFDNELIKIINLTFKSNGGLQHSGRFLKPVEGNINSPYGERIHPITGIRDFHTGIDIGAKWHDNINVIADGTVVVVNAAKSGYGNYILIRHNINGEEFYSFYAHLSKILVKVNDTVTGGDIIALEGGDKTDHNPGTSTGHHLHFEIRLTADANSNIDPSGYI